MSKASVASLEAIYRRDGRRIFATLVRLLGSFERAEEAEHEAFIAAAEQWPRDGVPANPVAWLVSVGRFKAIDRLRRDARLASIDEHAETIEQIPDPRPAQEEQETIEDDRLRLIFTCCHPSLSDEACIALTLREVCGLATEEIARAFLTPPPHSPSASFAPRRRSATPASPMKFPSRTSSPRASIACCA